MIRVVLDANQFVSALLKPGSTPDIIMQLVRDEKLLLVISEEICNEIMRVLAYPKISSRIQASAEDLRHFMAKIRTVALFTAGNLPIEPLAADPDDTKYLVCAVEGRADYIISGDHHLTDLKIFRGIRIVTPAEFLAQTKMHS
jgi:putative PIN family toxin of toxin-antitoxin system